MPDVPSKIYISKKPYLHNGTLASNLKYLPLADTSITETDIDDLSVLWELDVVEDNQRSVDLYDCAVVDARCNVVVAGSRFNIDASDLLPIHISLL
jgi:hypothetical protein